MLSGDLREKSTETGKIAPQRAALRRGPVFSEGHRHATHIGNPPPPPGTGENFARTSKCSPRKSTCSPVISAEMISRPSSSLLARIEGLPDSPNAVNSSGGSPSPTPRTARPSERQERVTNSLATFHGLRLARGVTSAPRVTVDVASARAPRIVAGSTEGTPSSIRWSQMKKPSQPQSSASLPSSSSRFELPYSPQLGK